MDKIGKNESISISAGTIIKTVIILVLFFLLYKILDIILVVLAAVVIASAIEPLILWFGKYRIKRIFGVLITYVSIILVFSGLLYFFVPPVLDEASSLLNNAPKYLSSITLWNPLNDSKLVETGKIVGGISQSLEGGKQVISDLSTGVIQPSVLGDLIATFRNMTSNVSGNLVNIVSGIFGGVLSFVLIVVLSFYLAAQEGGVEKFLRIITPVRKEAYVVDLWKRSQKKIGYWMQGQLLLGVVVGVLVYLGLMILGVQNALILAVLAGVLEIIPYFGPILSAIPAILFGFATSGLTTGLLIMGLFVIIQQFENHLIYPLVVKKVVGISPIVVILALIIGAKLAGFLGILLSVPATSILMEFVDDMQKGRDTTSHPAENKLG